MSDFAATYDEVKVRALALLAQRLHFELVSKGFLAGQDMLTVQIAVHHGNGRFLTVERIDERRNFRKPRLLMQHTAFGVR